MRSSVTGWAGVFVPMIAAGDDDNKSRIAEQRETQQNAGRSADFSPQQCATAAGWAICSETVDSRSLLRTEVRAPAHSRLTACPNLNIKTPATQSPRRRTRSPARHSYAKGRASPACAKDGWYR